MSETTQLLRVLLEKTDIIAAKQNAMDDRLGRVESRLDCMDERLDRMDVRFDRMDERFDQMETRMVNFEENTNKNFLEINQKIGYITSKITEHDMQLAILNQQQR